MAQERMDDWIEYAREHAKAERELKIEKWMYISIGNYILPYSVNPC